MRILPGPKMDQWAAALLAALWLAMPALADPAAKARVMVQTTLTAGLAHHEAKAVWDDLQDGDSLDLVREADNPHDRHAVRVDWSGHVLGYLPQADNHDIARQLDRGQSLKARIVKRAKYRNHRRKLEIEIYAEM
ncbi:MAG: HIRAN domain-containing protein [Burkholderiales bacterium]|nr:HIRAN domain-containing protein [Burkholderiales bacterium]